MPLCDKERLETRNKEKEVSPSPLVPRPALPRRKDMRPPNPTLRANPFPKVTDLFCRLPLPTLFYRLEAIHLGDLLRL